MALVHGDDNLTQICNSDCNVKEAEKTLSLYFVCFTTSLQKVKLFFKMHLDEFQNVF